MTEISLIVTLNYQFNSTQLYPRGDAGGLSGEYILRIPQRVVKGDLMGRRYIALVADTALKQ